MSAKKKVIRYQYWCEDYYEKEPFLWILLRYILSDSVPCLVLNRKRALTDSKECQDIDNESRHLWELAHNPCQALFVGQEQLLVPLLSRKVSQDEYSRQRNAGQLAVGELEHIRPHVEPARAI